MLITEHVSGAIQFFTASGWQTKFVLSDRNVISASCKRQCCADGAFEIGGVYASSLNLTCRLQNSNSFQIRGAKIILYSQYDNEENPCCIGTFWVTNATRSGEIFTLDAMDAVGWLSTSSRNYTDEQNQIFDSIAKYFESQGYSRVIQDWFSVITQFVNLLLYRLTGVPDMLSWQNYEFSENDNQRFCNEVIWNSESYLSPFLSTESGTGNTDCPQDLYHYLAEIAGGFIYAKPENGALTLGQFGQPKFGTAEIKSADLESDTYEIADFQLQLLSVSVQSEILNHSADMAIWTSSDNISGLSYFRYQLESNPFLDGFVAGYIRGDAEKLADNLWTIANGLWNSLANYAGGVHIRPFQCTVHKKCRYHLGQNIKINGYESIITSMTWTFRGGHMLACGGEDSRVMADCLRASKGDKVREEARNRCAALEQKIPKMNAMTQEAYANLEHPDENTLYVIV